MILDTTLREGLQRYGVQLDFMARWRILEGLAQAGIAEAEVGVCGRDDELDLLVERARRAGLPLRISVWCPLREESLRHARRISPDCLNLSIPVSEAHIRKRLKMDSSGVERLVRDTIGQALSMGFPFVSLGLEDASRAHPDFLARLAGIAMDAGARRIRPADTVGVLDPLGVGRLVRRLRKQTRLEIGFHGHNDFGMGTANALAALDAGADSADATLLGIGERAGIAATEELAAFLKLRRRAPLDPRILSDLCRFFARGADLPVLPWKPVVGSALFHAESGMHVQGLLIDPELYEPFPPEVVGTRRHLGIGRQTGASALRRKLASMGIEPPADLEPLVRRVRETAGVLGRTLEDSEILELLTEV